MPAISSDLDHHTPRNTADPPANTTPARAAATATASATNTD